MSSIIIRRFTCDICGSQGESEGQYKYNAPGEFTAPKGWKHYAFGGHHHACGNCIPHLDAYIVLQEDYHRRHAEVAKPCYAAAHAVYEEAYAPMKQWETANPPPPPPWKP